ncbi:MAG: GntR family transcriptional regulator [Gemmatimonadota bacterium]|nr:GntR family transcriptional regulator [Gemmatimonadota bacterium]
MQLEQVLRRMPRMQKQAAHELVAAVLREAITSGQLRGHEPLLQDEIAAQLNVSHIPVREALRQLQSEGLVTYQANRGATVTALAPEEIREIYEIRATLETAAIRRATTVLSESALAEAARILDRAESATDGAIWGSLDVDFHQIIYALDGRPRLQEMIDGLLRRVDRYWLSHGLMLQHRAEFDREHRALLATIERRDADAAAALLEQHLTGAAALLISELARLEAAVPPVAVPFAG